MSADVHSVNRNTHLAPILALTFCASLGTGMLWNGIPFITEKDYAFGEAHNLLLYICVGVVYIISALLAGMVTRGLSRWMSPRAILAVVLGLQAMICMLPLLTRGPWVVWVLTVVFSATSAVLWPIVESYLSAGRHGRGMRSAMGWWNVTWMAAVAAALWMMAPLMDSQPRLAIVGLGVCLAAAAVPLAWFTSRPGHHDLELSRTHVTDEYPLLLHSARALLPLSYVILAALAPLLPFLLNRLEVDATWQTPAAATWMVSRVVVVAMMWRVTFWHRRWGTLILGASALISGFVIVIAGPTLVAMSSGLVLLGAGMGIIYYTALYYAMSVGTAEVDAGGRHEALIGVGYTIGPAAGLAALLVSRDGDMAVVNVAFAPLLVVFICALTLVGAAVAAAPYRTALRRRRIAARHNEPQ